MKTKTALFAGIAVLIVGIILIFFHSDITSSAVVMTGSILFTLSGLLNIAIIYLYKDREGVRRIQGAIYVLALIVSICSIILGGCVLFFQATFMTLTPLVFGALVTVVTLVLFYMLAIGTRPVILPGWLYIFPTLCAVGAVLIFLLYKNDDAQIIRDSHMILYTGISLALYGACAIIGSICLASAHRSIRKAAKATDAHAKAAINDIAQGEKEKATKEIKALDDNK